MSLVESLSKSLGFLLNMDRRLSRDLNLFEDSLSVQFTDKDVLRQALVHSSYLNENPGKNFISNSRLEFLGDSVLGMIIAEELCLAHPDWMEGQLTEARSILVCGDTLATIASGLDVGNYLYLGKGEEQDGGRERSTNLAAAFEAIVAAIFIDQGLNSAKQFVLRSLRKEILSLDSKKKSAKSLLQEFVQGKGLDVPTYQIIDSKNRENPIQFNVNVIVEGKVIGTGIGPNKSAAEHLAAADALSRIDN